MHHDKRLRVTLSLLFLVGFGFIVLAYRSQDVAISRLLADLIRDLGVALCISVIVATIIEISLSRTVYLQGLDAIMMRTVPDDVWQEFRQDVVTQPVMRENFSVVMRLGKVSNGKCISTTTLIYTLLALQDNVNTSIDHELDAHRTPDGLSERFISAHVGHHIYEDRAMLGSAKAVTSDGLKLSIPVRLDKFNDKHLVKVEFVEELSCPDEITWWMLKVTRNVVVKIDGLPPGWFVDTKTFHPAAARKLHPEGHGIWRFNGIMMLGQGFELRFKRKP